MDDLILLSRTVAITFPGMENKDKHTHTHTHTVSVYRILFASFFNTIHILGMYSRIPEPDTSLRYIVSEYPVPGTEYWVVRCDADYHRWTLFYVIGPKRVKLKFSFYNPAYKNSISAAYYNVVSLASSMARWFSLYYRRSALMHMYKTCDFIQHGPYHAWALHHGLFNIGRYTNIQLHYFTLHYITLLLSSIELKILS